MTDTTEPQADDRLEELRTEYANTGKVAYDGAVWLISQVVVLRERVQQLSAALAVLNAPADRAAILDEVLPAWEAVYEPGNVSDYLIGYANDEAPAKAAAEAWMRSQAEVTGRLEWVPEERLAVGEYDQWFELIERHDDGIDTGPGLIVRRRMAGEAQQPKICELPHLTIAEEDACEQHWLGDEAQQPETQADDKPPVCEGFQWIGQSFATCDRCGQPAWEHAGEDVAAEGAGLFDNRRTVRPWKPGEADAIRAKWGTATADEEPTS